MNLCRAIMWALCVLLFLTRAAPASADDKKADQAPTPTDAPKSVPAAQPGANLFSASEIEALSRLTPGAPDRYLELGEDILDRPDAPERVEMARQLFVRAVEYARSKQGSERTAASAAIALASMSNQPAQRQWLRSIAETLHPDFAASSFTDRSDPVASARAAELLTRLRAGEGTRPKELLNDPAVRATMLKNEPALSAEGSVSLPDLDAAAKKQPCTTCGGRYLVFAQGSKVPTLCVACKGRSLLAIGDRDLAVQLRLQLRLLGDSDEQWGSQSESALAPARDPNAAEVAVFYGVDTKLTSWRDGRWWAPAAEPAAK